MKAEEIARRINSHVEPYGEAYVDAGDVFIAYDDWGGHFPVDEAEGILQLMDASYRRGRGEQ